MELNLDNIRSEINSIDDEIIKLYEKRLSLCDMVAEYKKNTSAAVKDTKREDTIIERLTDGKSEDTKKAIASLYREIFEISRSRQTEKIMRVSPLFKNVKDKYYTNTPFPKEADVACQGVEGAYSSIACKSMFENPSILYFEDFRSVFKSVESGLCKYGILPFENSIYGSVAEVYDMLSEFGGYVVRSIKLPIHHALLAKEGTKISDIKEVYSHKQAIGQCSKFLEENKDIKVNISENTAMAARMVADSDRRDIAAICSDTCAEKYNLSVLKSDLQNSSVNYTVFYCISREPLIFEEINKAAFMFNIENKSGSLHSVLSCFSHAGVNLTKIESRPISGKDFEFMFYAEADINGIDDKILALFSKLEAELEFFKFIGAYKEITI